MTLLVVVFVTLLAFTDYFAKYSILYAIFLIFLYLACKSSKIYYLFRPKEFTGVIKYATAFSIPWAPAPNKTIFNNKKCLFAL